MKALLYTIFAIIAVGIATVLVLSAKIIGFILGILLAIGVVAFVLFLIFAGLFNSKSNTAKSEEDNW